jgi:hypothetical protein
MRFSFDKEFPEDQQQPEAEKVLAARRPGESRRVDLPVGMHVHVRGSADRPWSLIEPQRGRGRPPKRSNGTWEDDDLLSEVRAIVGSRSDRKDDADDDGADRLDALCRLASRELGGQELTPKQQRTLRKLLFGGDGRSGNRKSAEKASVIERQLLVWRHGVTDPAVRRMQRSLHEPVTHELTSLVLKYETERPVVGADGKPAMDDDGRPILERLPVCDRDGQPILWVPDEHGQPSRPYVPGEPLPRRTIKKVRRPVTMIFR